MIKKNISSITLLLSLFFSIASNADAENTFAQRKLLLSHQFSVLEKNLATANDGYLDKRISIHDYFAVNRTFWLERDVPTPELLNALDSWLESSPKSAYAHVLMGIYWSDRAHQARGKKWAKDTSSTQIKNMNMFFVKAWHFLQKGLEIDSSIIEAYDKQLSITRTSSHYGSPQEYMRTVPSAMKRNIYIWDILLQSSIPRWGGSYARMNQIIKQEIPVYLPKLTDVERQTLTDIITYDKVDTLTRNNHHKAALKLALKSIYNNTDYAAIYSITGHIAYKLKDFKKCYDYEGHSTKLRPWHAFSWKKRGLCAIKLQQWQQANNAFRYTVFISGINKYDLFKLGMTYMYLYQFDKAYAVFKKADELDPKYKKYTEMYTRYIEKEKPDQMGLEGRDIYQIIGDL